MRGVQATPIQVDLAQHDGVHQLIAAIESESRPVDAVAVNAGVGVTGRFLETDLAAEMNMVRLNVLSTLHLTKYMAKSMAERERGLILITSSIAATMPTAYEAVYGATKAFGRAFAESIREELKDTGVSVTALMPGVTETNFFHRAGADDTKIGASKKDDAAQVAKQGFDALMAGKDHVVAGSFLNKVGAAAAAFLPESTMAKPHAAASEPGSAKN